VLIPGSCRDRIQKWYRAVCDRIMVEDMKLARAEEGIARQNLEDDVVDLAGTRSLGTAVCVSCVVPLFQWLKLFAQLFDSGMITDYCNMTVMCVRLQVEMLLRKCKHSWILKKGVSL
jgi:hypothetical protein